MQLQVSNLHKHASNRKNLPVYYAIDNIFTYILIHTQSFKKYYSLIEIFTKCASQKL